VGDLSDEEYGQLWSDHHRAEGRRQKQGAGRLHGEALRKAKEAVLVEAIKDLARQRPRQYMPGVRLFHRKACEYLATHLPPDAKKLYRRTRVAWRTIQRLTAPALDGWSRQDEARETARKSGLLRRPLTAG
jgi:hypothetical protein